MINKRNHPGDTAPISPAEIQELSALKEQFNSLALALMEKNQFPVDLSAVFPPTDNLDESYTQLTELKRCLDSFRPFDASQMNHLQEVYDTEYTYASNRIEGNTLSLRETSFVINEGLTIRNKSMREHLEAVNHKQAIEFIRELVSNEELLNERNIKLIHGLILQGIDRDNAGRYRSIGVGIHGTDIVFPEPYLVPKLMEDLMLYYEEHKDQLHPVQLAAHMHEKLVNIHPFIDGNGRTCRLVMNLILLQHGYPITIIQPDEDSRNIYFDALNVARDSGDPAAFEKFVADNVRHWAIKYLELIAPNIGDAAKDKGYYFFKKIEPYITD